MTQHDYRTKTRAVVLAALMVTSVFAGAIAFSGSAAAEDVGPSGDSVTSGNQQWTQSTIFQGQEVGVQLSESDVSNGDTITVRRITDRDSSGITGSTFVEQVSADVPATAGGTTGSQASVTVDTDGYETGDYFVVDDDGDITASGTSLSDTASLAVQDLSVTFNDDDLPTNPATVTDGTVELDLSSGRSSFTTNVSAEGDLDDQELFNLLVTAQVEAQSTANANTIQDDGSLDFGDSSTHAGSRTYDSMYDLFSQFTGTPGNNPDTDLSNLDGVSVSDATAPTYASAGFQESESTDASEVDTLTAGSITVAAPYASSAGDTDLADVDEKILLTSGEVDEQDISFVGVDEGNYTFNFAVTDTDALTSDSAQVNEKDLDASFEESLSESPAGDVASFTVSTEDTDTAYVQIGSENSNFVDVLRLVADDSDESMTVDINTRVLGTGATVDQAYDFGDNVDDYESAVHSSSPLTAPDSGQPIYDIDGTQTNFDNSAGVPATSSYLAEMGIDDSAGGQSQIDRPLQPTTYDIVVADPTADDGLFDADDGGAANSQLGSKTLRLTQPTVEDVTIHTAPEAAADDETNASELVSLATQSDEVAIDDRLVVQVEATGLFGDMVVNHDTSDGSDTDDFERTSGGVSTDVIDDILNEDRFTIEIEAGGATGNANPRLIDLDGVSGGHSASDVHIVTDADNGQFFIVADTGSDDAFENGNAPDERTTFDATVSYNADNEDDEFEFGTYSSGTGSGLTPPTSASPASSTPFDISASSHDNHPYLAVDEVSSQSASFELTPESVTFDNLNADGTLQVQAAENATISGSTNIAPGSSAELRLISTNANSSFRLGNDVTITEDGSFTTQFSLNDQTVGDEFDAELRIDGQEVASQSSVLVQSIGDGEETDDTETNETDTDDGEDMDDGEEEPADDGETNESADGGDDGSTDDGTPGFGAVVALIALIGAALLAVRRQN